MLVNLFVDSFKLETLLSKSLVTKPLRWLARLLNNAFRARWRSLFLQNVSHLKPAKNTNLSVEYAIDCVDMAQNKCGTDQLSHNYHT